MGERLCSVAEHPSERLNAASEDGGLGRSLGSFGWPELWCWSDRAGRFNYRGLECDRSEPSKTVTQTVVRSGRIPNLQAAKRAGGCMSLAKESSGTPKSLWEKHLHPQLKTNSPFRSRKGLWKVNRNV